MGAPPRAAAPEQPVPDTASALRGKPAASPILSKEVEGEDFGRLRLKVEGEDFGRLRIKVEDRDFGRVRLEVECEYFGRHRLRVADEDFGRLRVRVEDEDFGRNLDSDCMAAWTDFQL